MVRTAFRFLVRALAHRIRGALDWRLCRGKCKVDEPSDVRARYRAAVDALPEQVRATFLLHRVEGLAIETITARTGRSCADVEQQVADAIVAIGAALGGNEA